ncbi:hypothetical protein [Streptomyces sp. A0592]|uniref:hypothetical protein n=1 Tax=Streptomyces sp. A0592 TaxID=2563099 RepID=UPI00109EA529|nr:hypothetical protein [Streptomyces sp. A0592]THA81740.1 hypothetical protein E6U81_23770 [Streptomyces sp. A0592]
MPQWHAAVYSVFVGALVEWNADAVACARPLLAGLRAIGGEPGVHGVVREKAVPADSGDGDEPAGPGDPDGLGGNPVGPGREVVERAEEQHGVEGGVLGEPAGVGAGTAADVEDPGRSGRHNGPDQLLGPQEFEASRRGGVEPLGFAELRVVVGDLPLDRANAPSGGCVEARGTPHRRGRTRRAARRMTLRLAPWIFRAN